MGQVKKKKEIFRCGMVSIVGRPNVGKSTLLNKILEEKVAIVSRVPQTTRNQIRGIYNDEQGQIIFIDTPGLHMGKDKLDQLMNDTSARMIKDADCIIYLIDTNRRIGEEEQKVVDRLKRVKVPIILGLNKIDLKGAYLPEYISLWEQAKGKSVNEMENFTLIALSGFMGTNLQELVKIIYQYIPEGPALYPTDTICDVPQQMAVADIIREKLIRAVREEVPHAVSVVIEEMVPRKKNTTYIKVLILVERETQKEIVIGKGGETLKKVGILARRDLEQLLETKVFLEFYVKVQKKWREDMGLLQDLGYSSE